MTIQQSSTHLDDVLTKHSPGFVSIKAGEIVTGRVIGKERGRLLIDIGGIATGVVSGKELTDTINTAKNIQVGDEAKAFVLEEENEDGMLILSLRKAGQMRAWDYFNDVKEKGGTLEVVAKEANKGGLMVEVSGVTAFLPVSQLAPGNYPRVSNADATQILDKLQKLVGKKFVTSIILLDQDIGKLVVSERAASSKIREGELSKLKVGDIVDGHVNGIVNFGIFLLFGNLEGLVHISELTWNHVKNPTELFKLGDKAQAKVIGIEGDKISLSIKALQPDPWKDKIDQYAVGSIHKGTVNKVTNFGVFVTLDEDVNGLVHTSEFAEENPNPETDYKEGQEVTVKVLEILMDDHSLRLSFKGVDGSQSAKKASAKKKEADQEVQEEENIAPVEEEEKKEKAAKKPAEKKEPAAKKAPAKKTKKAE